MNSIKILFLTLIVINMFCESICQMFNGKCGYPGKPYQAKLEPDNKLFYDEGEEVTYQCTDFWSSVKTRRCERGRWTGEQPRCGDVINGILMRDSKLEDITDPDNPILMFEHLNMTITNTTWRYTNVFTSNRFKKARLRVFDTNKYKWTFKFTQPVVKLMVRINFNLINYTLLLKSEEEKRNFSFEVTMNVSRYRNCVLTQQNDEVWRENGRKTQSDFICDSISSDDHKLDIADPPNYMVMTTQASKPIFHDLIAVFIGKSYGTEEEPLCGDPETYLSQNSRFNVRYKDYIVDCKNKFKYISNLNTYLPETALHSLKCGPDMKWTGYYPDCIPQNPCSFDNLLSGSKYNRTVIHSFDGIYFFNDSQYYAIEGTEAKYGCTNPNSEVLVGKDSRTCMKSGKWSSSEPHCYDPNESSKFPVWLIIGILFIALILIISLTGILFYVYTKRIKSRITEQIEIQTRNEIFDDYDDVGSPVGKQMYDTTYEAVTSDEVRYAEPYYSPDKYNTYDNTDYVQMPVNVHMQSSDSYWRLPNAEPAYLDMTHSNRSSPCPPKTPITQQIYTYEL